MSQIDKRIERFKQKPKDFTWKELEKLLNVLGYVQTQSGKTSGSRRSFIHPTAPTISLHQPHPGNILKRYQLEQVYELLLEEDLL
jgi:predicted RNA binding protein YcfA (HicA-like mRNA interferase family)